ncbi:Phytochrome-like protein cph2 [bioreactor metagenome]|uniref:Phytochrome-like protein cph2 n=1 Tax=bioreactor metagenome TaxID=1076179 RepID=A0A645EAM2_9ZZZZ
MIQDMQVDSQNVCLEITESIFASNYQEINNILSRLKRFGIRIAIDDFGTGYSSLARVRELNVNCLKIDKYFIDKLLTLSDEEAITGDIISMAHKLGHYVIAEGIEQDRQIQYLKNFGCEQIQGYLIAKPLEERAALELLEKQGQDTLNCAALY